MNPDEPIPWIDMNRKIPSIEEELGRLRQGLGWLIAGHLEEFATDYRRRWATPWRFGS